MAQPGLARHMHFLAQCSVQCVLQCVMHCPDFGGLTVPDALPHCYAVRWITYGASALVSAWLAARWLS